MMSKKKSKIDKIDTETSCLRSVSEVLPFRSAYGSKPRVTFETTGHCQVQQSHKDDCDINRIVDKYHRTGTIDHLSNREALYGDFTGVTDFQTAVIAVQDATDAFNELPSDVRKKFDNDPSKLIEALSDPSRRSEFVKLGLIDAETITEGTSKPVDESGENMDMLESQQKPAES